MLIFRVGFERTYLMEQNPLLEGLVRPTKEGFARNTMNHRVGFILKILNKGRRLGKGKNSDWQTRLSVHSLPLEKNQIFAAKNKFIPNS